MKHIKKIFIISLMVLIIATITQFIIISKYKSYISEKVNSSISAIVFSVLENDIILDKAIDNNELTNLELNRLGRNYNKILSNHMLLNDINRQIKFNQKIINSNTAVVSNDFSMFISIDILSIAGNSYFQVANIKPIELSKYMDRIYEMKMTNEKWSKTIKENIIVNSEYSKSSDIVFVEKPSLKLWKKIMFLLDKEVENHE